MSDVYEPVYVPGMTTTHTQEMAMPSLQAVKVLIKTGQATAVTYSPVLVQISLEGLEVLRVSRSFACCSRKIGSAFLLQ